MLKPIPLTGHGLLLNDAAVSWLPTNWPWGTPLQSCDGFIVEREVVPPSSDGLLRAGSCAGNFRALSSELPVR
jgi:hypothetical protein